MEQVYQLWKGKTTKILNFIGTWNYKTNRNNM